jgi:hypothetical protein
MAGRVSSSNCHKRCIDGKIDSLLIIELRA